ncbi:phosphatidylserine decarboxylase proenzyme [Xylaria scruposa]|nr:phosphatidylserine decarboxylase proenzyme [Xylaria scruposa]
MASIIHQALNYLLSWASLAQNSQYGWESVVRKTGDLMHEEQPLKKKLKLLLLFNSIMEWIDTTHAMRLYIHKESLKAGEEESTPSSKSQIRGFVDAYGINMEDFDPSDINAYQSFADFFTRKHTKESRLVYKPDDASSAVVVADSRVVVYDSIAKTRELWIKGRDFSITNLVMDTQLGARFDNAAVASFRLSPQDYHRYHSPVTGRVALFRSLPGDYYQVDPIALQSHVDILTRNARDYVVIETEDFGDVLFVAIGATDVGSVQFHKEWQTPGSEIRKGDELGLFQFGGSSIVVAFQAGRIKFDADLSDLSMQRIQIAVEVGMSLGSAA